MVNRLEPINVTSFTGGLNLRRSQFQLGDDESPDLLNVDIDPRGGFFTRSGWRRWNATNVIDPAVTPWKPTNVFATVHSGGDMDIYVANANKIHYAEEDTVFHQLGTVGCSAVPHGADFAAWGDDTYIAVGADLVPVKVSPTFTITNLAPTFSEIDTPVSNCMPQCEFIETHGGYMFCAATKESGAYHHNRVRWSHPGKPDSWRNDDYIDIDAGSGRITNMVTYNDHLVIFKTNSMWALYGYNEDSWQLVKVSASIGCPGPAAATRSEKAVYFFSGDQRNGIYGYNGEQPIYLSEALRPAFEDLSEFDNIYVSWAGRRLWVSVPWVKDKGPTSDLATCFVMDPDIGDNGAWTMYRSDFGCPGPVVDGSDVEGRFPLSAFWSLNSAVLVTLDAMPNVAYDMIDVPNVLAVTTAADTDPPYDTIVTGLGEEIEVTGVAGKDFGQDFDAYYRTRWLHGGWPDRKKSWRRPTFVCRQVSQDTDLLVESYRDYDEGTVHRTRTLHLRAVGNAYWTEGGFADADIGGFDWTVGGKADPSGRGQDWGAARAGATLERAGSMGLARAVQMKVRLSPVTPRQRWGVDAIIAKIIMRRFR